MEVSHYREQMAGDMDVESLRGIYEDARTIYDRMDAEDAYTKDEIESLVGTETPVDKQRLVTLTRTLHSATDVPLSFFAGNDGIWSHAGGIRLVDARSLALGMTTFTDLTEGIEGADVTARVATKEQMKSAPDPLTEDPLRQEAVMTAVQLIPCSTEVLTVLNSTCAIMHEEKAFEEMLPRHVHEFAQMLIYTYQGMCALEYVYQDPELVEKDHLFDFESIVKAYHG